MTPEEEWIEAQVLRVKNQLRWSVDYHKYRRPTHEELVEAFTRGLYNQTILANVAKVTEIINATCGTSFDPSDVAWWRVGLERRMKEEHQELLARVHDLLARHVAEKRRREREARLIAIPIDPAEAPEQCPCCQQILTEEAKNHWVSRHRTTIFAPRKPPSLHEAF
ncbi:hypothetical protein [Streptomyces silvisoli]|uniref:Uncharacterized protein n=1 Tax=Streptomyces silvisoli TaxID=3034235 RepID=A0ABT5ZR11_9ACTN|nr:hypothetical protein [Streptomyces silvisoli]MDF3292264.1 hypothetical protein [Streptomyces silvisoli]